jgi:predicted ABC-type ATPase
LAPRIPVVSADAIAADQGLSPIQAGKAAVKEAERLLAAGGSFAIDTTLAGNRELALMKRAGAAGYKVNLIFVSVKNLDLCRKRIQERVEGGGQTVPPADVARRGMAAAWLT